MSRTFSVGFRSPLLFCIAALALSPFRSDAQLCEFCTRPFTFQDTQSAGTTHTGLEFQYIYRSHVENGGDEEATHSDEKVADTILNVHTAYDITDRFSVELNVPLISRAFTRTFPDSRESGRETGIGDLSVLGSFNLIDSGSAQELFKWSIRGGAKLPTGDSTELEDESNVSLVDSGTLVRGRDMARGSGSFDFPVGTTISYTHGRVFVFGDVGYIVKLEGDSNFQYGNDLGAAAGASFLAVEKPKGSFRIGAIGRVNNREKDKLNGDQLADSGNTVVSVGPSVELILGNAFLAHVEVGVPVYRDANGAQLLPDYQVHVSATAFF